MSSSRSSQRSSISPFRSRKGASASSTSAVSYFSPVSKLGPRPSTPSSTSSARPSTPSARSGRPMTPRSVGRLPSGSRFSTGCPESPTCSERSESVKSKENVTVTVRFRPLSAREINKGDEIAWYADGEHTVRNEYNANIGYGFDRVFGPATTTRHVYDVAAQQVVSGAMEGINGTVFAYGVTSSGKTHTMHGEQKSPGIIPLAVKDVFSIIQETPGKEFLLRVSYLEIYNEVINDLLDPTGQNLRIREDTQGTYVEGIKEEVVLSPAHALSLIASGEEHRHVGSNNFNLLSSRSHTIFTMTIESSSSGENHGEEDVTLSQLNLIDLAGSESSKTETTGLRRKEGSYINKSLLTLGTVIAKLTDNKSAHVPYRDSKLTRLLQSSLSGHGRVSLICTVTPASSNSEETHNTIKFAHRSKNVEIKASQNKIIDEKSLIKKYQKEISSLRRELQQLKQGMLEKQNCANPNQEDLFNLKLQLEAGQVKLQTRLEEEEQAKAALMGRIQRLTKLILVSTKSSITPSFSGKTGQRRRHSFDEDELAYLPDRKREYLIDDDAVSLDSEISSEGKCDTISLDESVKFDKRNKRRGMLGWFKSRKSEYLSGHSTSADNDCSASESASSKPKKSNDMKDGRRKSISKIGEDPSFILDSFSERTQAGDLFSAAVTGRRPLPTGTTITDQMDLLHEQVKMLAGEVALCTSSLKRFSEQAAKNPDNSEIQAHMQRLKDEISEKKLQMRVLEQRMIGSFEANPHASNILEMPQALSKLAAQLNEKTFELEIMSADNRILQEQLQIKISENAEIQETVVMLRRQLDSSANRSDHVNKSIEIDADRTDSVGEACFSGTITNSLNGYIGDNNVEALKSQILEQAAEIENLRQEKVSLIEEKDGLQVHSQKLSEEASYAKELASAAAMELRNLAEEVTKLSYQNAKLNADLNSKEIILNKKNSISRSNQLNGRHDINARSLEDASLVDELQKELIMRCQTQVSLEAEVREKDKREAELQRRINQSKRREKELENELADMWVLIAKLKKSEKLEKGTMDQGNASQFHSNGEDESNSNPYNSPAGKHKGDFFVDRSFAYENKRNNNELESKIPKLKCEDQNGLDVTALDESQSLHPDILSKFTLEKLTNRAL